MDDALLVRGVERERDLARVVERGREGQRAFQRLALHQLHDEVVGTDVVQRADVGMIQRGDGAGFALESIAEVLGRHLDGDVAADAGIVRAVDDAHSACANLRDDLVGAEAIANRRRHGG